MSGPGQYLPDSSEGISCLEDLPEPKIIRRSRNFRQRPCPHCGKACFRNRTATRILHDLGHLVSGRPHDIHLVYSQHHRKMQKTVYRIRTQKNIHNRIAVDMFRDSQKEGRTETVNTLHEERAG